MKEVLIRALDFSDIQEVHAYLKDALDFPDYYGANLDALYDVLTEMTEEVQITMDLCGPAFDSEAAQDDQLYDQLGKMAKVMQDAAMENPHLSVEIEEYISPAW